MEPCVSVIIPSYNRAKLLPQVLPSYLQKEVAEVIIVDDASMDNTKEVVEGLIRNEARVRYIRLEQNSKQPHAQNVGVAAVRYPYIYFADDDSFLTEGTIGNLLQVLNEEKCDIAAAKALYMHSEEELQDIEGYILKETSGKAISEDDIFFDFNRLKADTTLHYARLSRIDMCQACFMIKTEFARKLHFDENLKWNAYREETDYLLQAIRQGAVLYGVPNAYQINLPRKTIKGGGAHVHGKLLTLMHTVYNNHYFLKKHYSFLKKTNRIKRPMVLLEINFVWNETVGRLVNKVKRELKQVIS
jgi:Predicted glycosyltransferases